MESLSGKLLVEPIPEHFVAVAVVAAAAVAVDHAAVAHAAVAHFAVVDDIDVAESPSLMAAVATEHQRKSFAKSFHRRL